MHSQQKGNPKAPENKLFFSKYQADKKIGEGSFGKIYSAHNITNGQEFALKLESKESNQNLLEQEAYILCYLKGEGIPFVKSYGYSGDHNVLVMELLGQSLEDLFQKQNCKFSIKTVCMLGIQMITRLENIHIKHILHRDIKPDNFTIGRGDKSHLIYLIDFGLSKKYRSSRTLQHIKYSENKKLTGTARYASINALKGCEQGRRDDMEAIGYVLMYFLRGSLPWQGLKIHKGEDRYQKIYEKKKKTSATELCKGFPNEFSTYIEYTRNLGFEEEPKYEYLRGLLQSVLNSIGETIDYNYDWCKTNTKPQSQAGKTNKVNKLPLTKETKNPQGNLNSNNINMHNNLKLGTNGLTNKSNKFGGTTNKIGIGGKGELRNGMVNCNSARKLEKDTMKGFQGVNINTREKSEKKKNIHKDKRDILFRRDNIKKLTINLDEDGEVKIQKEKLRQNSQFHKNNFSKSIKTEPDNSNTKDKTISKSENKP
ncbi:MAG: casein kinase 1 family protein [archaeon]|nr:casein kinase 1 family protein [archaeon]